MWESFPFFLSDCILILQHINCRNEYCGIPGCDVKAVKPHTYLSPFCHCLHIVKSHCPRFQESLSFHGENFSTYKTELVIISPPPHKRNVRHRILDLNISIRCIRSICDAQYISCQRVSQAQSNWKKKLQQCSVSLHCGTLR